MDYPTYENVMNQSYNNRIYCSCVFEFKDEIKKLGFKWDPNKKLWWIEAEKLSPDILNKTLKVRFSNSTSIGILKYYFVNYQFKCDVQKLENDNKKSLNNKSTKSLFKN